MSVRRLTLLMVSLAVILAACSSGSAPAGPSGSAVTRLDVSLTDSLKMEPATVTVPAGIPVIFVVTNTGVTDHEFYLGDEAAQADHEVEMASMPDMMHDVPEGIALKPGETKELTYTFGKAGMILAACHETGHYDAGMTMSITVAG